MPRSSTSRVYKILINQMGLTISPVDNTSSESADEWMTLCKQFCAERFLFLSVDPRIRSLSLSLCLASKSVLLPRLARALYVYRVVLCKRTCMLTVGQGNQVLSMRVTFRFKIFSGSERGCSSDRIGKYAFKNELPATVLLCLLTWDLDSLVFRFKYIGHLRLNTEMPRVLPKKQISLEF